MPSPEEPLHDFPDRAHCELLEDPANLRELIAIVLPDLVDRFDFGRVEILPREGLLPDWRRRESDMFFRLPFRDEEHLPPAVVCLLVEQQSQPEQPVPLRLLLYAVLAWDKEWQAWSAVHPRREPLGLTPIIPIVLHTGSRPWNTNRTLADLIRNPESLKVHAPGWAPLFLDITEQTPEEWLQAAGAWHAAMAVVRAERMDRDTFHAVFVAALQRIAHLSETEPVRWHELLRFVLGWGIRRRPMGEQEPLIEAARESHTDARRREEVARMTETTFKTWEEEMLERGQLRNCRENLQLLLQERFGPLPEAVVQRIEGLDEMALLRAALRRVVHVSTLEEMQI